MSSPSRKIDSSKVLKASDQVVEHSPKGAEGGDCLKGSGRTRAAVPNLPLGEVREAKLLVRDPTCLSMS
ncbi:hypothetical protein SS1G_10989 [Sclerotinia sclerotiorum 1980 UF-70]|uniref:Uncharacterized protein n=1 Tax=Sclerotinia sclerotiorum (strain ATCC 18683 / 1980 / Ss-1) TaxID=665079 RepID=A7F072_SCLS1|nr:hypothetical protein SS1G_10989 [Sclerotinia sclerotiorum 1980 UF-70]EDN95114.1 hypothetical protein SS1G_10989 [Sclerotinia sclerotiorum 1980 UF-70]